MKRSKFNLTHLHSTTGEAGYLIPFFLQSTLPGDRYRISLTSFIRAQPMLAPLMHQVKFYTQYWFVPYRILWDNWEDFITGGADLDYTPNFPYIRLPSAEAGTLHDYFGFPLKQEGVEVSAMPYRAYVEIWNTRYRDEDLQSELSISYGDGLDNFTSTALLSPSWKRDYFTTARPFTQRGVDVSVPVYQTSATSEWHNHQYSLYMWLGDDIPDIDPNWSIKVYYATNTGEPSGEPLINMSGSNGDKISKFVNNVHTAVGTDSGGAWLRGFSNAFEACVNAAIAGGQFDAVLPTNTENVGAYNFCAKVTKSATGGVKIGVISHSFYIEMTNFPIGVKWNFRADTTVNASGVNWTWVNGASGNKPVTISVGAYSWENNSNWVEFRNTATSASFYFSSGASGIVQIRDLRASSALQRYAERSLQWGNRYEEFIQREFGIKPRDSRIQRPEYLGGGSGNLQISEVLQTAEGADTGVGTMRGHAVAGVGQRPIKFTCPEHGLILGLISIRPVPVYTQGIEREFLKRSRLDFFTPELANIGMQEVLQQELYATKDNKETIFGYSDRYQEYRYRKPMVTGQFRTDLAFWNMARHFSSAPLLNASFINMSSSVSSFKRPFAVQSDATHSFLMMLRNNVRAWRPIPKRAKNILR